MPMYQPFVDAFMTGRPALRARLADLYDARGDGEGIRYADVVRATFEAVRDNLPENGPRPRPDRIWELCAPDGFLGAFGGDPVTVDPRDLSGTLVYVIPEEGHDPGRFWYVRVEYGSCSACDTLRSLLECEGRERAVDGMLTLCLHVVQQTREMEGLVAVDRSEVTARFNTWANSHPISLSRHRPGSGDLQTVPLPELATKDESAGPKIGS